MVDSDGRLTGECIPGDTAGYSVCDIGSTGSPRSHEHATEALIEASGSVEIMADYEHNAELFWQNLAEQLPVIAQQLQSGATEVDAETWAQIQQIEGFSGGPAHAPHAIVEVSFPQSFETAADLQSYVDARCSGLIIAVSSDGLEVAFGDKNHSPTEAEFEALSGLTADYVDGVIAEFILATQTN